MKDFDVTLRALKNRQTSKPLFLYIIYDYKGDGKDLKLTNSQTDIVYNDLTYSAFPIVHESISESTSGEISSVQITLSNVSRLVQAWLENYDFRGKKVLIRRVWREELNDPDAYSDDAYYIDSYTADQNNVIFTLTSKFDVLDITIPYRKFSRNYCPWKFKDASCKYAGSATTCDKTLVRCRQFNNQINYGAFPAVPSKRIFGAW